jgi:hypothetical protein
MCRRSGLEQKRRCGWLQLGEDDSSKPIWARGHISLTTCPKSYITGESMARVEDFFVRWRFGRINLEEMTARETDAFLILEEAMTVEMKNGRQDSRNIT